VAAVASYNASMTRPYDVCIRGAGIVGSTLALHLAAKRLRVALVRQDLTSHDAHSDVRAYAMSPASRAVLETIRCWPDEANATPVLAMEVQSQDDGRSDARLQFAAADQGTAALNWIVDVPVLEGLLAQAVQFQPLITVQATPSPATLTVVCEGRASSTRAEFGVTFDTQPYHQWAIATRVQCARAHSQVARQWFAQGDVLALLPLDGPTGDRCAVVWSVSEARAAALQALDPEDFCRAMEFASQGALGALSLVSSRHVWPLQSAQAQRWTGSSSAASSWVLAGDAAHSVHPLAGQGLNLGLGDVAELVRVLDTRPYWCTVADPKLLRAYERARKTELALVGGAGDALQQIFCQTQPTIQALRSWGMQAFDHSGLIKRWVARRAMGAAPRADRAGHHTHTTPGTP